MLGDAPPEPRAHDDARLLSPQFAVVMLASFAYFTAMGSLLPTVPRYIEGVLGGGGAQVGVGVGVYAVSAALLRPVVGRIGDAKGRRVLAVFGAAIVAVSIVGYSLASALWILVIARLVTGVGEAAMFVGVATAAQDLAPDHRRGEAASYFSVALYGGLAVGPPVGEALVRHGYTTLWFVMGACAGLASIAALWIPTGRTYAVVQQRRFLQPDALWPGLILFLGLIPFVAFVTFVPIHAQSLGMDNVGGVLGLYAGLVLVIRIVGARIPDRIGWRRGSTIALLAVAVAVALVASWPAVAALWVGAIGLALGMSLLYPSLFTAVMFAAPAGERSHAVGTFSVFFDLSMGVGASVVGVTVSLTNERGGFATAAALALVGLGSQILLRHRIGRRRVPEPAPVA